MDEQRDNFQGLPGLRGMPGFPSLQRSPVPRHASYDVAVIGAGPAGSLAAFTLARAGRRVLLVERARFPRAKVCGCCLAWGGVEVLERAGLRSVLHDACVVDRVCLWDVGEAGHGVRAISAEIGVPPSLVLSREVLDDRLCRAACEAGAECVEASASATPEGVVRLALASGGACEVRASVIIVADGLSGSSVREVRGLEWRIDPASRMGCGAVLREAPVPLPTRGIVMIRGSAGYLGLARLPSGEVDAAAAFDPGEMKHAGGPGALAARFVRAAGGDDAMMHAAAWKGTPTLTRRRERVQLGRIVLAGDAASYVEPFTGEGMSWAMVTGHAAGCCADEALRGEPEAGLASWCTTHQRLLRERHRSCGLVAAGLRSGWMVSAAIRAACVCPPLGRLAARVALGGTILRDRAARALAEPVHHGSHHGATA